ncbi:MAG: NADH-quinone oxidoreductase subunit L [Magnetococcales bacterium]|nr:NADH-quinone oxidoreductase subunit L [Magnetococcales bacterium]
MTIHAIDTHLLGWLQLLPILGALWLLFVQRPWLAWPIALITSFGELLLSLRLYQLFDPTLANWQWYTRLPLTDWLIHTSAADGITVLFVLLSAFLCLLVLLYGGLVRRFQRLPRFFTVVLASEATLVGQFATLDLLWYTLMATLQTGFVGYLLSTWSLSSDERRANQRYYQFMGTSILLLLAATLMLGWHHAELTGGQWTFEWTAILGDERSPYLQNVIFFLLFYGLAIRVPLFPLHGWLPQVMEHGTVAAAMVLLLGLKTGIHGMLRFLFPLFPEAAWRWHAFVIAIAAVGILYSALLALVQKNLRKLLAYAVVSHTGILVIGLFSLHPHAFQGSIMLSGSFGLAISTLMLMVGIVHQRTESLGFEKLGGLLSPLPLVGIAFLVAAFSVVGMPGTPGFDAVHLLLEAAIERFGALVTVLAALGNVAAAACLLWAFQRAFLASHATQAPPLASMARTTTIEKGLAALLIAVQLASGFNADPWLALVKKSAQTLAAPFAHHGERP